MATVPDSPLTIEPDAARWREMLSPFPNLTAEQRRFRDQLGLPTDRPIVMSGHQAQIWHPGILAKYLAADAAARAFGATPAWLVVDQDENDPGELRYPLRGGDGRLRTKSWHAMPEPAAGTPTGLQPAAAPGVVPAPAGGAAFGAESVLPGLDRVHRALAAGASELGAARQSVAALAALLTPLTPPMTAIFATDLAATEAFRSILERIVADPGACIRAYNAAAARHPDARIRALAMDERGSNPELPLWRFDGSRRLPVRASDLVRDLPRSSPLRLAPRALLMTGLLRSGACDLFIHGTGGGGADAGAGYDVITDEWFDAWLGAPPPAPVAVVTATLRLPIPLHTEPGTPQQVGQAAALAHRAAHDPALLGDAQSAAVKRDMVARIRALKQSGADGGPTYRQMHAMLARVREAHQPALEQLRADSSAAAARLSDARILADRTWPFPLYPDAMLRDLKARIDGAFGLG